MLLAAAVLTLGVNLEVDLRALVDLIQKKQTTVSAPNVTCGIKVVGYHIAGRPGQKFSYAGDTYTIPREGFIEVISLPRVHHYVVDGRKIALEDERMPLDGFSFRWIALPATPIEGGTIQ